MQLFVFNNKKIEHRVYYIKDMKGMKTLQVGFAGGKNKAVNLRQI